MAAFDWNQAYARGGGWETGHSSFAEEILNYIRPPATVLDHGCGSGRNAAFFVRQGFMVSGFDPSPVAIEKSRKQAPHAVFLVARAEELPYKDGQFNVVFSAWVLAFCENWKAAAEEMLCVAKDGGLVFLATHLNIRDQFGTHWYSPEKAVRDFFSASCSILKAETFTHKIEEGKDPHPGQHEHDCLKLILQKR